MIAHNHHQQRAVQENDMRALAAAPVAQLHEVMLRYHIEKCRTLTDGDSHCLHCSVARACVRHHMGLAAGHIVSVVDLVDRGSSTD